jgi:hypothetical protein
MRSRTSRRYCNGYTSISRQLWMSEYRRAARRAPKLPAKSQFLRLWKHPHSRKRWLFIGHPHAGWRSAVNYSIIVSCRRRGINPETYLTDVLRRLPSLKITEIEALLPARWQPPTG